ncbi:hypothetical protein F5Y08DRAFT_180215 [Xylaria arbuscula]|uniref:Vacuolar ATPase assembly protein VMA22 n=1 Tax=Xylaria arbuscula TaxID=114810 RepID=A0A9W8TNN3_9PEZI|nr:hypothetical protein F5Y08DRAFT_180215 [Xylaria arbuscula]KAJ3578032.1 hypothetical protein NPX13_g2536 [Xylaria arbuscula]
MDQDHIDGLLERYLHLLHEYASLREELAALQTGMYQNIARANFAAERGVRFGQDYYDDRMQASRRLAISYNDSPIAELQIEQPGETHNSKNPVVSDRSAARFTTIGPMTACSPASAAKDSEAFNGEAPNPRSDLPHPEAEAESISIEQSATDTETHSILIPPSPVDFNSQPRDHIEASPTSLDATPKERETAGPKKSDDPLRWFGLLTPMPLRQAQKQSIRAVQHVIPRLASLDAEMALVEIEVRRARKRRAKAEVAANKSAQ